MFYECSFIENIEEVQNYCLLQKIFWYEMPLKLLFRSFIEKYFCSYIFKKSNFYTTYVYKKYFFSNLMVYLYSYPLIECLFSFSTTDYYYFGSTV